MMNKSYDVAALIWPAYTGDEPRSRIFWPEGDGEWQTVRNAAANGKNKPAHYHWDRKPLWGYQNEADPKVMEQQIQAAHDHGVNVFIYDWYWYDHRPFLENCLRDGYLKARNNDLVKFYIMWSNHDANHVWDIRNSHSIPREVIWSGKVEFEEYQLLVERWIDYFRHPSYYKIQGKPVFMLYHMRNFLQSNGGLRGAKKALDYFRQEVKKAGFPGLHLQGVAHFEDTFQAEKYGYPKQELYSYLEFDSVTQYQMESLTDMGRDYEEIIQATKAEYDRMDRLGWTYFPNVSVGWDNNPRFLNYQPQVAFGNTPEKVEKAFRQAKDYIDTHSLPAPLVVVNSWNEWTETSYLLPDNLYGYGYLEALKRVFK